MEALKGEMRKFNDQGQNPSCEWNRVPGGNKGEREMFRCSAHEDCTVMVRLLKKGDAFYMEKLKDTKHSNVRAVFDRKNAALTKEQKASFMLRKQGGSSASEIMKKDQQGAVTAGAKRKEGADATGVEGVPFGRKQTPSCSRLSRAERHSLAFICILTHSHACARMRTHFFASSRICTYAHALNRSLTHSTFLRLQV